MRPFCADDGTISVKNSEVNYDGTFRDICGYADIPNPAIPGELQVQKIFWPKVQI
jgi:hypothetical protein